MPYSSNGPSLNDFQGLLNSLEQFRQDRQETKQARENNDPSYFQKEARDLETLKKFKNAEKPVAKKTPPKKK